jgi:UDPglucose 6-dehydrogenase
MTMNISALGTGYVGLITGTCFAQLGKNVTCVDKNEDIINGLKISKVPIYEPDLETIVEKNASEKRLTFTTSVEEAVKNSDAIFICVGTPSLNDGTVDLKYIYQAATEVAHYMNDYKLIIIKSTVPIGTCKRIKDIINLCLKKQKKSVDFDIVSNPEFLREGCAVNDFMHPDRIIIGTENEKSEKLMKVIYNSPIFSNTPFIFTTLETSEMIKYASNAFLATKISYINEIADICEHSGADILVVAKAMGLDKRIGKEFLHPGPGFGGSCFPKDTRALIKQGKNLGCKIEIIEGVLKTNSHQIDLCIQRIKNTTGELKGKTFTVLGLSFKADTADIRESPSINIVEELLNLGGTLKVFDPQAMDNMKKTYPDMNVKYCENEYEACAQSDCIIFATEWGQFREIDFTALKGIVRTPVVIDLRNIFTPSYVKGKGFIYKGVGR